jgi:hypothetical protein
MQKPLRGFLPVSLASGCKANIYEQFTMQFCMRQGLPRLPAAPPI